MVTPSYASQKRGCNLKGGQKENTEIFFGLTGAEGEIHPLLQMFHPCVAYLAAPSAQLGPPAVHGLGGRVNLLQTRFARK